MLAGATLPMFSIIFGDVINALGGSPSIAELVHQVDKVSQSLSWFLCKMIKAVH